MDDVGEPNLDCDSHQAFGYQVIMGTSIGVILAACVGVLLFLVRKQPQRAKAIATSFIRTPSAKLMMWCMLCHNCRFLQDTGVCMDVCIDLRTDMCSFSQMSLTCSIPNMCLAGLYSCTKHPPKAQTGSR